MAQDDFNWLELLRLGASLYGAGAGMAGAGAGAGGVGLPDAGATAAAVAPAAMPVSPLPPDLMMPAGASLPPTPTPTPRAVAAPAAAMPTPPIPPGAAPAAGAPAALPELTTDAIYPGPDTPGYGPSWWRRNIGDPLDKAFTVDPKAPPGTLSPGMKALQGVGSLAGKLGTGSSGGDLRPTLSPSSGGYKPSGSINASQLSLAREQARQLLQQRATLNAPWLKRRAPQGLME